MKMKAIALVLMLMVTPAFSGVFDLPQETDQQRIENAVTHFKLYVLSNQKQREEAQKGAFNLIWHNPKASPQEMINAFGNEAVQLFILSRTNEEQIKAINPDWEYLVPPYEVTLNEDGTVTIGDLIPEVPAQ